MLCYRSGMRPVQPAAKKRLYEVAVCFAFLALLSLAVGSQSRWLDVTLVCAVWAAFLIGLILIEVRTFRFPKESASEMAGQVAMLPRSWRRWILDEHGQSDSKKSR